ncbi:DUF2325 domain-containing protein [Peribacillus sp. NPDC097895]|uniref:DUF2325 domain-containing protein n=1 Tax=Peribacillus sp. NPDC097895 TaxID=3390619 RepID=UPI003D063C4A
MQSLLVVGGDKLGNITKKLEQEGYKEVIHLNGRNTRMTRKEIPRKIDLILVLTDYINHNLSIVIKRKAQKQEIPIRFSKRSWCSIYTELKKT